MKKICIVTGSRAEYGLLYWLMKGILEDKELELQLIVTGMHLSPEHGFTYKEIESNFKINKKIEMLLSSDTAVGISKSMGLAQIGFAEAFEELKPDLLVILGDRYEILSAANAALIANIPIAHLHGGESTLGAIDEAIRHSISKMSHLHFVSTVEYRKRVIQLGENPKNVYHVGALGIENISKLNLFSKDDFEKSINFSLNKKNILFTFHPETLSLSRTQEQFEEILKAIDSLKDTHIIFTKANSDMNGKIINNMIDTYVLKHSYKAVAFVSLGQVRYLSALQYVDAVVGNSSSGLIEAASFKIGTINIGKRQEGRLKAKSVIDVQEKSKEILSAFDKLYSKDFQKSLLEIKNPYEKSNTSSSIINTIKTTNLKQLLHKKFYDII